MRRNSVNLIFLISMNNGKYKLKDLSDHFQMSDRSIRYEIENANDYLRGLNYSTIKIDDSKYYYLDLTDDEIETIQIEKLKRKYLYSPEERQAFIIMNIFDTCNKSLEELTEILEVSKSTLDIDLREIRKTVKRFGLTLHANYEGCYSIVGDEWSKRQLLNEVSINMVDSEELMASLISKSKSYEIGTRLWIDYLDFESLESIYTLITNQINDDVTANNYIRLVQMTVIITIWLKRINEGNFIKDDEIIINKDNRVHILDLVHDYIADLSVPDSKERFLEEYYLSYHLEAYDFFEKTSQHDDWANLQLLTIKFISLIEQLIGIKISSDQDLFKRLYLHLEAMTYRLNKSVVIKNPLEHMIKEQYNEIFEAVNSASYLLEEFFENTISDSEKSYITIHISASKEQVLSKSKRKYRVAVVCGHGTATGELLSQSLQRFFPIEVIAVLDISVINRIKRLDVDFIVSTIKVDLGLHDSIMVNPILKEYDKKQISKYLIAHPIEHLEDSMMTRNHYFLDQVISTAINKNLSDHQKVKELSKVFNENGLEVDMGGIQPMISDILDSNKVMIKESVSDWKESIVKVAQPLLEDGTIKEGYVDAMIQSVLDNGPYIVLDKGIALAHAKPGDDVMRVGVSVMTLDKPINFDHDFNDPVEIIFCLAAVDGYSHLEIMRTLSLLINQREKLDELIASESVEEFLEKIERFEKEK